MAVSPFRGSRFPVLLMWVAHAAVALAADLPKGPITLRMGHRVVTHAWTAHQGAPDNWITGITDAPDGTVWFCTPSGVARINRLKVDRLSTDRGLVSHRDLAFDNGGLGWLAGHEGIDWASSGAPIGRLLDFSLWQATAHENRIRSAPDGRILVREGQTLRRVRRTGDGHVELDDLPHPPSAMPRGLAFLGRDEATVIHVDTQGSLWRSDAGMWRIASPSFSTDAPLVEVILAEDREHRIWLSWLSWLSASGRAGLSLFDGHQWHHAPDQAVDRHGRVTCFAKGPDGGLVAGTEKGYVIPVTEFESKEASFRAAQDDSIECLAVDVDQVWWVGTRHCGLLRIAPSWASLWSLPGRMETYSTLALEDGSFLAATASHGLVRFFPETIDRSPRAEALGGSGNPVTCAIGNKDGIWAATPAALIQYGASPQQRTWERIVHRQMDSVRLMTTNSVGDLVAATSDGHIQIRRKGPRGHRWDSLGRAGTGVLHGLASCPETLWAATQTGLFRWVGHCWQPVPETHSLGPALAIAYVPDLGGIAVGFKGHLVIRSQTGLSTMELAPGFGAGLIVQIVADRHSNLGLGTSIGLVRITRAALTEALSNPLLPIRYDVFPRPAGLPGGPFTGSVSPGPSRLPNGDLIFPTQAGLLQVSPDKVRPSQRRPRLRITDVQADGNALMPLAARDARLEFSQPRVVRLRFDIGSVDADPPHQYRHRALPSRPKWQHGSLGGELTLSTPPMGLNRIEFEMRSGSSDWQPAAAFEFFVTPSWYAGPAAKAAAALVLATLPALTLTLLRRRKECLRRKELEESHRIRRERHRIARDLHDHLGNRLSELQILAEQLQRAEGHSIAGTDVAERIRWRSMEASRLLGELVHLLEDGAARPWPAVVELLRNEAAGYLETAGVKLRFTADPDGPTLAAETRQQLLAALRELLHNAVRHAHASSVTIHLIQASSLVELEVTDNGPGFDIQRALNHGHGLAGLQERALQRNGVLRASSAPGETRIQFAIPPKPAHPTSAPTNTNLPSP